MGQNKSQRIKLDSGNTTTDKFIKIQLDQTVDIIEFLSMSIETKDVYQDFNADYGVLVGRVIANGGIGVPNAKISVFIPLSDADAEDSSIANIYPYKTPRDKNNDGKRYNLLPRVAKPDLVTGLPTPKQPFGSFPIKEELVTNVEYLDVYKKYYKYTALTNNSGDYMIFGVPIGTQTIHLSVDITDIGEYSMNAASMVTNLGYSPNLFTDNNSKIKESDDLTDLPHIETQEISVDIIPFWGDQENFTIGITRQDFRIRSVLKNTFIIFGSTFTDNENSMWGEESDSNEKIRELYRIRTTGEPEVNYYVSMKSKRPANITEKIYYYPENITDSMIDSGTVNPITDMKILDNTEYSYYKKDGNFVFIINCNRNKIVTDELGIKTPVSNDNPNGIYTKFRGFITLEIAENDAPMNFSVNIGNDTRIKPFRYKIKFPQHANVGQSFSPNLTGTDSTQTNNWRKQHFTFTGGTIYSISNFNATVVNTEINNSKQIGSNEGGSTAVIGFLAPDDINIPYNNGNPNRDYRYQTGIILTNDYNIQGNEAFDMPNNSYDTGGAKFFGGNWLNFTIYFPQLNHLLAGDGNVNHINTLTNFQQQATGDAVYDPFNRYFLFDNTQYIAANDINTKWFTRSDLHWTDFVVVPKTDLRLIYETLNNKKGFSDLNTLTGKYRDGTYIPSSGGWTAACPINGGSLNGVKYINGMEQTDPKKYFYKGLGQEDCIDYLISLGLL